MIYEFPSSDAPIKQGDIFVGVPRIEMSLAQMLIVDEDGAAYETPWEEVIASGGNIRAILPLRPVCGIVITQDCDAVRARDISLCEINDFRVVERLAKDTAAPKKWMGILTQHARLNLKWFYLPPDSKIGFNEKMAVDFTTTLRIPRLDLERYRQFRKGRLNEIADEHFRERLGEFFKRYPYDEWYPLDQQEFAEYQKAYPDAAPFPWQRANDIKKP